MTQANDSITVTPGTGATVATQLVSGKEYQVVVMADQNGDMDPTTRTKPYIPAAADILSNSVAVQNSTTATTIITIPAGRTWYGNVGLEVLNTQNASATPLFATITVVGTNASPANGTAILQVVNHRAANVSMNFDATVPWTYVAAPVGNSVTLQVQLSEANASHACVAFCNGVLL